MAKVGILHRPDSHRLRDGDSVIRGATGVLFNVTGPSNLGLHELNAAARVIAEVVDPDAEIIFGTAVDDSLNDEVRITVIGTGFATDGRQVMADVLAFAMAI